MRVMLQERIFPENIYKQNARVEGGGGGDSRFLRLISILKINRRENKPLVWLRYVDNTFFYMVT